MKIAVMGSGGVGGYFGARLAKAGNEVGFIARGAHLDAMRAHGLRINSDIESFQLESVTASEAPGDIGAVDVVLFAVKLYDTAAAAERIMPLIADHTVVISLPNGIDSEDILCDSVGRDHVAGGVARISASIETPGVIAQHGGFASLEFGELDGASSDRLQAFATCCEHAGIRARVSSDIVPAIWRKFCFLASFAGITALTRLSIGPIRRSPPTYALYRRMVEEVLAVARAKGVSLDDDELDQVMRLSDELPDGIKASMLVDLERGRPIEVEWLSGAIARLGVALGVPTPVHDMVLAALLPLARGRTDEC